MNRHTAKMKENKVTHILLLSFLGFGIVVTTLNWLAVEPSLTNIGFYIMLFIVLALLYKPLGLFLIQILSYIVKSIRLAVNRLIISNIYKINKKRINQLNCIEIAQLLRPIFEKQGYKTELKKGSKEIKSRLVISKNSKTYVVQAKRKFHKVGTEEIYELLAAVKEYHANGAIIITNQYYTSGAKKLAKASNVKLVNRNELVRMLKTTNKKHKYITALSYK